MNREQELVEMQKGVLFSALSHLIDVLRIRCSQQETMGILNQLTEEIILTAQQHIAKPIP